MRSDPEKPSVCAPMVCSALLVLRSAKRHAVHIAKVFNNNMLALLGSLDSDTDEVLLEELRISLTLGWTCSMPEQEEVRWYCKKEV